MGATGFDVDRERHMLRYKLDLLEEFMGTHEDEPCDASDECRVLQYKIECISGIATYQNLAEDLRSFYEYQRSSQPDGFIDWMDRRKPCLNHQMPAGFIRPPAALCCYHRECINYVYGFHNMESLKTHIKDHHTTCNQITKRRSFDTNWKGSLPTRDRLSNETEELELTYVPFDPASSTRKREGEYLPHRAKRVMDKENMKLVKDRGACLRCKILKKKCDNNNPCSHCPLQDSNTDGDHWKVLGCHRSPLEDLSRVFLPEHLSQPLRYFKDAEGFHRSINLVESGNGLVAEVLGYLPASTASRSSSTWCSVEDEGNLGVASTAEGNVMRSFTMNWATTARGLFALAEAHNEISIGTAYTPIDLMRSSRRICEDLKWQSDRKTELDLVHLIISEAIDFFAFERELLHQMPIAEGLALKNRTPNDTNLKMFLKAFSNSCSRRNTLSAQSWVELFHSLCLFSIYKTIMIDAYTFRTRYESPSIWKQSNAIAIDSVYRGIVSIFTWASDIKDPILSEVHNSEDANTREVLECTREMVKLDRWKERGIKSSKDFLINLGNGIFDDGMFNGFVIQTYRLDKKLEQSQKVPKGTDRMSLDRLEDGNPLAGYLKPRAGSQTPLASTPLSVAAYSNRDLDPNPSPTQPDPPPKITAVYQWLDTLSLAGITIPNDTHTTDSFSGNEITPRTTSDQYRSTFGYQFKPTLGISPDSQPLGSMHTESWLENNGDVAQGTSKALPAVLSLVFED